jgi:hypothetical protein
MSIFIFTGPTLSPADGRRALESTYLPPAAEGDIYRAALQRPRALGIIDGYFQFTPAVRHKEILWAMAQGIHVFGSASMGALRAAELAAFGMEGVGTIFEWYRDGVLEDDDEVAIAHGPAETGYLAGSEAMVNIRQTLRKAERSKVISEKTCLTLEETGKRLFYPERNYPALLQAAAQAGTPPVDLKRLEEWLPANRVNQKREDALAMLQLMRTRFKAGLSPKRVSFSFQQTAMWHQAIRPAASSDSISPAGSKR